MKIFVAIPGYDGKLHFQIVRSLLMEQSIANRGGDEFSVNFLSGNAGIVQARNQLATEFLQSGFDRLVFIDSDITWEPGAIVKLAHHPVNFVGGCYRYKHGDEKYPIAWVREKKELRADANGLLEVAGLPTGFLALSRDVFNLMLEKYPDRNLTLQCGYECFAFFQMPVIEGHLYGEDFFFCREWSEIGGKIYLDPEIELTHWGFNPVPHKGHIGNWLKNRPKDQFNGKAETHLPTV